MLWGSHVCQFFSNGSDLRDTLVPFFKAGLQKNERCLLVAMAVRRERRKQIDTTLV
jgi:hypothetical protein